MLSKTQNNKSLLYYWLLYKEPDCEFALANILLFYFYSSWDKIRSKVHYLPCSLTLTLQLFVLGLVRGPWRKGKCTVVAFRRRSWRSWRTCWRNRSGWAGQWRKPAGKYDGFWTNRTSSKYRACSSRNEWWTSWRRWSPNLDHDWLHILVL